MKNLRGQLETLKENINLEYDRFSKNKFPVDFAQREIDRWGEPSNINVIGSKRELQEFYDNGDFQDMDLYDFFEFLPEVEYVSCFGDTIYARVIKVDKNKLYVWAVEGAAFEEINFSDIMDVYHKIDLLEEIENFSVSLT